ncbi:hypothetical protein EV368DRAFT_85488 [Lentinula lateritia]|nr:hypothetical protein EV368DRAFT_85488 [Lentinula lateritia]
MNNSVNASLPNPVVYLNYLPPTIAAQFEVARNLYLATLGAFIWDMLSSIPQDLVLIKNMNFNVLVYIVSRLSALGYVLLSVVAKTTPISNCTAIELGVTCNWVVSTTFSSFLFLRRVNAVYSNSAIVCYFFTFLWVANIGISILTPLGAHAGALSNSGYCLNSGVKHYVVAATAFPLVFDSFVFLAISYRLMVINNDDPHGTAQNWGPFLKGKALPRLSRAVLQGGQQYYLITVGMNILITVLIATPSVPPVYEAAFTIPDVALTSSMACRVYRNLYLEARGILHHPSTTIDGSLHFARRTIPNHNKETHGLELEAIHNHKNSSLGKIAPMNEARVNLDYGGQDISIDSVSGQGTSSSFK